MGYWNQRKKARKINIFIKTSLVLVMSIFALIFINFSGSFSFLLEKTVLYIFTFTIFLTIVSIYNKLVTFSVLSFVLSLVSFIYLNSAINLFFNEKFESNTELKVLFAKDLSNDYMDFSTIDVVVEGYVAEVEETILISNLGVSKEGIIGLSPKHYAYFAKNIINEEEVMFIGLSFSKLEYEEARMIYQNLAEFIVSQSKPVIIYGDFGVHAWSKIFKKFLHVTSLEVKNKIILSDMIVKYNPFVVPSINILGYKYMGVEDINFLPKKDNIYCPILFKISL